ncbi:sugar ABC transporter ATP-binding protein [Palleronia sp. LCG004]|uniref:sugar ABC transporter ATP-binding protein n=1 Tax=Palleronia sp. LCG004 TaxID=3079304 RepID=UPI002942B869|nr:sugar ABC transporter ATP-binding protein [Palleronia sp. LCG004]WOI56287.1 sugar ABC transporter ATP-binding protein [Palleronia sp. LCG004]
MAETALLLDGIVKTFPGVRALDDVRLEIRAGEVHGLVGENGAGKSTIIKVLAGIYAPDEGRLEIAGKRVAPITPEAVHEAGIRFIHQELHLVPHFTVAESVFMGQEIGGPLGLRRGEMRRRAEAFLRDVMAVEIAGNRLVRDLGTAERKLVQIARALIDDAARVVVFDEPTAPLASDEVDTLMGAIARLKSRGIAVLYVSHYLSEITDICDRVTVLRNGRNVAVFDTVTDESGPELVASMVGRELSDLYPQRVPAPKGPLLKIDGLAGPGFEDVSLTLHEGEILGIAGLIGSGREELIDTLYGLARPSGGAMELAGERFRAHSPADALERGIVLVPRDRRHDGLVLPMTVSENINLATLDRVSRAGIENRAKARSRAEEQIRALDIRPPRPESVVRLLSGGNQQKVVLGRWLAKDCRILLLDEPTVGVDVGARSEIYGLVDRLAREGRGVIVSSSDPSELIGICDRIAVMMRGRIVDILDAKGLDIDRLVAVTTGARTKGTAHV